MKQLIITAIAVLVFSSVFAQAPEKNDSTMKVDIPLIAKIDTIKYARIMYSDANGLVRVDSATVIISGKGNNLLQGFWAGTPTEKIFVRGKQIKSEDFITIVKK